VFLAFGIPTLVAALAMQPPVQVETFKVAAPIQQLHPGRDIGPTVTGDGDQLHVRFKNDGDEPIKRIVFELNDGTMVADVGTFAPGVTIDHTFDLGATDADMGSVESVTFADGTHWSSMPSGTFGTSGPSAEGGG
jgi:hypothetical protein